MSTPEPVGPKIPEVPKDSEDPKMKMAAALEDVLSTDTLEALVNVKAEDLTSGNPQAEIIKGTALRSCLWIHSPAHAELLAVADKRLTRVGNLDGIVGKYMERAHARWIKGTKLVVITGASPNDLSARPVVRYANSSSAWINLLSVLSEAGLTIDTGYKERYDVAFVPKVSPLWPGLVVNLGEPKARVRQTKKKTGDDAEE